ncbi:MAG: hypothetical protein COA51_05375 [Idiomarina sp.]|nr:MAG: hypothetical protein COA51_05375 [Idiomarina sp.]
MRLSYGFTLIELLITLSLGLIIVAGVLNVFVNLLGAGQTNLFASNRQQQTEALLTIMTRDLRRMGYGEHSQFRADFEISAATNESNASCITFSYDANLNGKLESEERFGYRVRDERIQRRRGASNCNDRGWASLTERSSLLVKALQFKTVISKNQTLPMRQLLLELTLAEPQSPAYLYFYQRRVALYNVR